MSQRERLARHVLFSVVDPVATLIVISDRNYGNASSNALRRPCGHDAAERPRSTDGGRQIQTRFLSQCTQALLSGTENSAQCRGSRVHLVAWPITSCPALNASTKTPIGGNEKRMIGLPRMRAIELPKLRRRCASMTPVSGLNRRGGQT